MFVCSPHDILGHVGGVWVWVEVEPKLVGVQMVLQLFVTQRFFGFRFSTFRGLSVGGSAQLIITGIVGILARHLITGCPAHPLSGSRSPRTRPPHQPCCMQPPQLLPLSNYNFTSVPNLALQLTQFVLPLLLCCFVRFMYFASYFLGSYLLKHQLLFLYE